MIKRYKIIPIINSDPIMVIYPTGQWVEYDDIKYFIPDNRVTEKEIKEAGYDWIGADCVIKYAKQKGWIKPEVKE